MRAAIRWTAVLLALPFAGCYEFDAPLGPPTLAADTRLMGSWRCVAFGTDGDSDKIGHLQFKPLDPVHDPARYEITSPDMCDQEDCPAVFRAYPSRVGDATILNTQIVEKDGRVGPRWSFVRARLYQPNVLHLDLVDDDALAGVPQTSEALARALGKRMKSTGTFVDYALCVRVEPKPDKPL